MNIALAIYQGTGLKPGEIPDSPLLLDTIATAKITTTTSEAWITRQEIPETGDIKIAGSYTTYVGSDYLITGTGRCFWITAVNTAGNENIVRLSLQYDAMTSRGGPSRLDWDGWVSRKHAVSDGLLSNNLTEDFDQLEPWVIEDTAIHDLTGENADLKIIGSTCELVGSNATGTAKAAITFTDPEGEKVTFPITKPPDSITAFYLSRDMPEYLRKAYGPAHICFYRASSVVRDQISIVRGMGAESSIIYSYVLPGAYYSFADITNDRIGQIGGIKKDFNGPPVQYSINGYIIKNNKVFSGQFNQMVLYCPSSGSIETYRPEEITNTSNTVFMAFSDPAPEGRPYFRPKTVNGDESNVFNRSIAGSTWQSEPLAHAGASGSAIDMINAQVSYAQTQQQADRSRSLAYTQDMLNAGFGLIGLATSPMRAASAIASGSKNAGYSYSYGTGLQGLVNRELEYRAANVERQQDYRYNKLGVAFRNASQPIVLSTSIPWGVQTYGANVPVTYRTRWGTNDIIRLDQYFSAYGYATSEPLTGGSFIGRANHNYVKATGECISSAIPAWEREIIANQLANGVRVWHVKPSVTALYDNPIA